MIKEEISQAADKCKNRIAGTIEKHIHPVQEQRDILLHLGLQVVFLEETLQLGIKMRGPWGLTIFLDYKRHICIHWNFFKYDYIRMCMCVCVFWKYRKYGITEIPNHLNMPAFSR